MAKKKSLTGNTFLGNLVRDTTGKEPEEGKRADLHSDTGQAASSGNREIRSSGSDNPSTSNLSDTPSVENQDSEVDMIKATFRYRYDQIAALRILGFADRFNTQQDYIHTAIDSLLGQEDIQKILGEGRSLYVQYLEKKVQAGRKLNEIDEFIYNNYKDS